MNDYPTPPNGSPQSLSEIKETVGSEASKLKEVITSEARATGGKLKEEAKSAASTFKEAGKKYVTDQQSVLSRKADELAKALGAASGRLQEGNEANLLAGPADELAGQLSKLSAYLRSSGPEEVLKGIGDLARRKPELVFGGLFLAGLIGTRFLKASGQRASRLNSYPKVDQGNPARNGSPAAVETFSPATHE